MTGGTGGERRGRALSTGVATLVLAVACTASVAPPQPPVAPSQVSTTSSRGPDPAVQPRFPIRAAFFYAWFPEGWEQKSLRPYTHFRPALGYYDSGDRETIAAQILALSYGHFQAALVSWWGPGEKHEMERISTLLSTAAEVDPRFRLALYYEDEGSLDPAVEHLVDDLEYVQTRYAVAGNYLRVDGRPVIFVYSSDDQDCSVADRWSAATAASDFYVVLKVFPGWQACGAQPDGWHEYAPASSRVEIRPDDAAVAGSVSVSPGFWRAEQDKPVLSRDLGRWRRDVAAMAASHAEWHLVSSFNEWGEGTTVEGAVEWSSASGQGLYLDALNRHGH